MRAEILKAIEAAKVIEEQKAKLVVGSGISRVPKDSEGNIFGSPIMVHFDAGKGVVFFRVPDEDGDPYGFEISLPVAEALGLALNDLLGLFDSVETEEMEQLKKAVSILKENSRYFSDENKIKQAEINGLNDLLEIRNRQLAELEYFAASVSGLYATDRPDLIDGNRVLLFKIEPTEAKK